MFNSYLAPTVKIATLRQVDIGRVVTFSWPCGYVYGKVTNVEGDKVTIITDDGRTLNELLSSERIKKLS